MKRISVFIAACVFAASLLTLTACRAGGGYYDAEYFLMDSYMTVRLSRDGMTEDNLSQLSSQTAKLVKDIESEISAERGESDTCRFNYSESGISDAGEDFRAVLSASLSVAEKTKGAYDPTLYGLIRLWNVTGGGPVPRTEDIEKALADAGYEKIVYDGESVSKETPAVSVDFGGIGKGYAVGKAVGYLSESEVRYGLCSFLSTVGVFGEKPDGDSFVITVCDPDDTSKSVGEFSIKNGFISSSGDYERFFEEDGVRYHHILDPETGYPAQNGLRSVSVYSSDGAVSDALSTALFVMGVDRGMELYRSGELDFEAVFVTDGGVYLTDGLKDGGIFALTTEKYKILNQ